MNKVVDVDSFYKKIYYLKILSKFRVNIIVKDKKREYQNSSVKHPDKIDEILKMVNILNTHKRKDRYSLIYDYACDYLDNEFLNNNWCDFKKNMCISNRNKPEEYQVGSCCTRTANRETCHYFDDTKKRCSIRCLSCKFFVCRYLESHGIKYRVKDIPYLKYFLSLRQKLFARISFFRTKEEIISDWLKFYKLP